MISQFSTTMEDERPIAATRSCASPFTTIEMGGLLQLPVRCVAYMLVPITHPIDSGAFTTPFIHFLVKHLCWSYGFGSLRIGFCYENGHWQNQRQLNDEQAFPATLLVPFQLCCIPPGDQSELLEPTIPNKQAQFEL
jgi:hypothetical protein